MARYHAIKSFAQRKLAQRNRESIVWNFSGSTLIHILIILGLGFYISLPAPSSPRHTISLNLTSISELRSESQIGEGRQTEKAASQPAKQQQKQIIHTDDGTIPFDSGAFLIAQQRLIEEIRENNIALESAERIGFLGVYDVHPAYRQYQQYWQNYVSEFGTKNYPRVLLDKGLNGTLELDIAIDKQGVVRSTDIHRSSGNVEIDSAAIEIAMLAGPYSPLPEDMAREIDILHIIRTWEFKNNTLTSHAKE